MKQSIRYCFDISEEIQHYRGAEKARHWVYCGGCSSSKAPGWQLWWYICSAICYQTFLFAKCVLQAMADGTEDVLLQCDICVDSIKCTHWPGTISEFVFEPEHLHALPGKEDVLIWYGVSINVNEGITRKMYWYNRGSVLMQMRVSGQF